jgi:hypothetical protein
MGPVHLPRFVSVRLSGWDVGPTQQRAPGRECVLWWVEMGWLARVRRGSWAEMGSEAQVAFLALFLFPFLFYFVFSF